MNGKTMKKKKQKTEEDISEYYRKLGKRSAEVRRAKILGIELKDNKPK